jgi:hypothetical protein
MALIKEKQKEYNKAYNEANKEKKKRANNAYRESNKDKLKAQYKAYREANKDKIKAQYKAYREANKDKIKARLKAYHEANKDKAKAYKEANKSKTNAYLRIRTKTDIQFKIRQNTRRRLNRHVKQRLYRSKGIYGINEEGLIKHIESQFQEGMTWDNYSNKGWHIDHRIPCTAFDLTDESEAKRCFHYTNLTPMWAKDNMSKGNKWSHETRYLEGME